MEDKKTNFSSDDFIKGLMLAGVISPINEQEIEERRVLEKHENRVKTKNVYFKRVVLAAKIVDSLHEERTFGRVKFQKMVYLCENACKMDLQDRYAKFAAGPFDNRFMHSINKEFKKQKWFDVTYREYRGSKIPVYNKLENIDKYKEYYQSYFGKFDTSVQSLLDEFRFYKTREIELVATIFACLMELKNQKFQFNQLITLFYDWAPEKHRFTETEIQNKYEWMVEKGYVPF